MLGPIAGKAEKPEKSGLSRLGLMLRADYVYLSSTYVDKDQYKGQYLPGAVG